jgi:hypothetical protein
MRKRTAPRPKPLSRKWVARTMNDSRAIEGMFCCSWEGIDVDVIRMTSQGPKVVALVAQDGMKTKRRIRLVVETRAESPPGNGMLRG